MNPRARKQSPDTKKAKPPSKQSAPLPWPGALFVFLLLLALPASAALHIAASLGVIGVTAFLSVILLLTFVLYLIDKRRSIAGQWRIPEWHLHFLELLGGWPAALLAQRVIRHKTKKKSFQSVFWLIVFLHQFFAFEIVTNFKTTRTLLEAIQSTG